MCMTAGLALAGHAMQASAAWSAFTDIFSHSYSEPFEIHATVNELDGHLRDGDWGFTHDHVEMGVGWNSWSVSAFARYDYLIEANDDTAELAFRSENDLPVPPGRDYQIKLRVNHSRSRGFKIGYSWQPLDTLSFKFAAAYLSADSLLDGGGSGELQMLDTGIYDGYAFVDYTYSRDPLFDRQVPKQKGRGYAVDVGFRWQATPRWRVSFSAYDVIARIRWPDAPFTRVGLTSSTVAFDDQGFIDVSPVVSGIEDARNHNQRLPARVTLGGAFQLNDRIALTGSVMAISDHYLPEVGVQWRGGGSRRWTVAVNPGLGGLSLGFETSRVNVVLTSDAWEVHKSHYLKVGIAFRVGGAMAVPYDFR